MTITIEQLDKMNQARHLLPPPGDEVVTELIVKVLRLRREVTYLRHYGNRDCTAQADEAMTRDTETDARIEQTRQACFQPPRLNPALANTTLDQTR
jgi:hypothetical protein